MIGAQIIFTWLDEATDMPYSGKYQNQRGTQPAIHEDTRTEDQKDYDFERYSRGG